jgi:hypothetical protein
LKYRAFISSSTVRALGAPGSNTFGMRPSVFALAHALIACVASGVPKRAVRASASKASPTAAAKDGRTGNPSAAHTLFAVRTVTRGSAPSR